MDKKKQEDKLGDLIRQALRCQPFVSIEHYEDEYHVAIGDWQADHGKGPTPEAALQNALGD